MQTHLSLPLVWHICTEENNSHRPRGKASFIAEFKSLVKPALERIYTVPDLKMQIIFPPLSAFKSKTVLNPASQESSELGSLLPFEVRVNGVEHCWLLLKISPKVPVQSRLNSLDNFFRLLGTLAPAQATLSSHGPGWFSNLLPNSSQSFQRLWLSQSSVLFFNIIFIVTMVHLGINFFSSE